MSTPSNKLLPHTHIPTPSEAPEGPPLLHCGNRGKEKEVEVEVEIERHGAGTTGCGVAINIVESKLELCTFKKILGVKVSGR